GGGTFFGKKGDSGSVVVDGSGNVVGLYFAGNTTGSVGVANPIQKVLGALNVAMCTGGIGKKIEIKEFVKEYVAEKPYYRQKWFHGGKELIKDWKEWAYEKFDFEGKTVAFEGQPWEIPVDPRVVQPR